MSKINKIKLSGITYDVEDLNAPKTVELTQAQYDNLPSTAKTSNTFFVITDATPVDMSNYYTTAQTQSAITEATSGKVDTSDFETYSGTVDTAISSKASQSDLSTLSGTVTGHTADTSIHVTAQDKAAWNAKSDFSGDYNDLANKLSAGTNVTIIDNVISAEGGGGTVDQTIISGSTNAVAGGAVYDKFDEVEQVTAAALNQLNDAIQEKQDQLSAGTNITIVDNVISAEGGGSITIDPSLDTGSTNAVANSAITTALNDKALKSQAYGSYVFGTTNNNPWIRYKNVNNDNIGNQIYYPKINGKGILTNNSTFAQNNYNFQLVETSAITTTITSSSTDSEIPSAKAIYDKFDEIEEVTAAALNQLNDSIGDIETLLSQI